MHVLAMCYVADLTAALVAFVGLLPLVALGRLLANNSLPAFFVDVDCFSRLGAWGGIRSLTPAGRACWSDWGG